jgi:NAD-dependent dihydropyrimidine dehydrogenase PreA subunit
MDPADCKPDAGRVMPLVDLKRCEGKDDCVEVCPHGVFEVRTLHDDEKRARPLLTRLKLAVHGNRQAFVIKPEECHSCGACVTACPEKAITLVAFAAP